MSRRRTILALLPLLITGFVRSRAFAQEPVVHAVLFFSPTCPHCHRVITEDLPPLAKKYGDGLVIAGVDVATPEGETLFKAAARQFDLKPPRYGVPTLVVGSDVMVGDREIPQRFPGLIERGLAAGGVDWPQVPALRKALAAQGLVKTSSDTAQAIIPHLAIPPPRPGPLALFRRDPLGNGVAVVVLLGLLGAILVSVVAAARGRPLPPRIPSWLLPLLATVGMGVASYLAFVEVNRFAAVCGPVGDCNAVQQSPYAFLFGIVPVGILGQLAYLTMFGMWLITALGPPRMAPVTWSVLWGMALVGTGFSAYLTYLEPFVIGATCMWCLTSSVVMALILLVCTPQAIPEPGNATLS